MAMAGQRPHLCTKCGKGFKTATHLKQHVRCVHTKDRPHKCQRCSKSFARMSDLNRSEIIFKLSYLNSTVVLPLVCFKSWRKLFLRLVWYSSGFSDITAIACAAVGANKFLLEDLRCRETSQRSSSLVTPLRFRYSFICQGTSTRRQRTRFSVGQKSKRVVS